MSVYWRDVFIVLFVLIVIILVNINFDLNLWLRILSAVVFLVVAYSLCSRKK